LEQQPFPILSTKRLILRRLENTDTREIFALRSNSEVNQFLDRQSAATEADAAAFIHKITDLITSGNSFYWAICLKENPKLVGTICLFDFSANTRTAEIGYELHPFYQHRGIMQEALTAVIYYCLQVMKLKAIIACPSAENQPSIKLLEKNGFVLDDSGVTAEGHLLRYILRSS